jgi:hypothetical protein
MPRRYTENQLRKLVRPDDEVHRDIPLDPQKTAERQEIAREMLRAEAIPTRRGLDDPRAMTPEEVLKNARAMFETPEQREERERMTDAPTRNAQIQAERVAALPRIARIKLGAEKVSPDERAEILGRQEEALRARPKVYPNPAHVWTCTYCACPWDRCKGIAVLKKQLRLRDPETRRAYTESTWLCRECHRDWITSTLMDKALQEDIKQAKLLARTQRTASGRKRAAQADEPTRIHVDFNGRVYRQTSMDEYEKEETGRRDELAPGESSG